MSEKATTADVEAARRERDEMRERAECAEEQLSSLASEMIYEGNSVSYIYDKMKAYKISLTEAANNYDQLASIARGLSTCITQGAQLETPDMLDWIADRLVKVHGEDPNVDYVMTLRVRANNMRAALSRYTAFMEGEE